MHTAYALLLNPELANKDTSGMSRFVSAGIPVNPLNSWNVGLSYPPAQVLGARPVGSVQWLFPPLPPTICTAAALAAALQLVSALAPKDAFVQDSFQVVSGM
jgi:hypothetical protein